MLLITEIVPSLVVAPASTYADPSSTVAGLEPRIEIIGKTVSGGVAVLSVTSSATMIPRASSIVSTIDSSNNNLFLTSGSASSISALVAVTSSSSTSSIARSTCLLSTSSSVEYASTLSVISAISPSVIARPWVEKRAKEIMNVDSSNLMKKVSS